MKLSITLIIVFILTPQKTLSQVNMLNSSFTYPFKEAQIPLEYNSRSLHYGKFGFGWCSLIDTELEVQSQQLTLKTCGQDKIYNSNPTKRQIFRGPNSEEFIFKDNKYYWLQEKNFKVFNSKGQILEVKNAGNHYKFVYTEESILEEIQTAQERIRVEWDGDLVVGLYSSKSIQTFVIQNNSLREFIKDNTKVTTLKYDDLNNLEEIKTPQSTETIVYNKSKDMVMEYKNKNGCHEKYNYKSLNTGGSFQAEAKISCSNGTYIELRHTFYLETDNLGHIFLSKSISLVDGKLFEKRFLNKLQHADLNKGDFNERLNRSFSSSL